MATIRQASKFWGGLGITAVMAGSLGAANPTVEQALTLKPIQAGVAFDLPTGEEVKACTMTAEKINGHTGWVVKNAQGQVLRRFIDDDDDGHVNLWCYFKDGVETYRDADTNANRKVDQSRYLNLEGTRWGIDTDENGTIDQWKQLSAEEVTKELILAVKEGNLNRFVPLLLTEDELASLKLGDELNSTLREKLAAAKTGFVKAAREQKVVTAETNWTQFGAAQPGLVPPESTGGTQDLIVYENVLAMVEKGQGSDHLTVGTLVQTNAGWRLIDLPTGLQPGGQPSFGFFFNGGSSSPRALAGEAPSDEQKGLLEQLDALEKETAGLTGEALIAKRADLLEQLTAASKSAEDRDVWARQFADVVTTAWQAGEFPNGKTRLDSFVSMLKSNQADAGTTAYVAYRTLMADYVQSQTAPNADFAKVQEAWLKTLETFIKEYPKSNEAAEALLEVATTYELAGQTQDAAKWYGEVVSRYGSSDAAEKAAGAKRRLDSVGKSIPLVSSTVEGKPFDLSKVRGKIIILHYWASWSDLCRADLAQLKELQTKYAAKGLTLVGVSLDNSRAELKSFLSQSKLPWAQVYEEGGLEGRLAKELGIRTVPTILLLNEKGQVVNNNLHVAELDTELGKLLK